MVCVEWSEFQSVPVIVGAAACGSDLAAHRSGCMSVLTIRECLTSHRKKKKSSSKVAVSGKEPDDAGSV